MSAKKKTAPRASYLERKIDFLVDSAEIDCVDPKVGGDMRQVIALDILEFTGQIFARRDLDLFKNSGKLLSVFPILKKNAEGIFLEKLRTMEDACLSIQVLLK